ncbi:MAG: penicillin-binding transpeptidase domain-containing protein [Clostridia bacterium]|jgi:cell division protein FtsI/penicillin-binding protein 2|nr:penicillin-binding transpeptidase domain-containing protein [Clostridium sp.]MEE0127659.1 penicillin-binding transpeptidase domain-containing protein [Clostridia bacterium]HJJ12430.1 penicillin-binding transpeptidase domain-containing protein [Clostridiaceae bacterium]
MKNKKILIGIIIITSVIIGIITFFIINKTEKPDQVLQDYFTKISEEKYEEAYEMLSESAKNKIAKDTFVKKNDSIYKGIDMTDLKTEITNVENNEKITYNQKMNTSAGEISFTNEASVIKEDKKYKINWKNSLIYPYLNENDKIRVKTLKSERGNIYDRNNILLAGKGNISSIGLVPGKMSENKEEDIQKLSTILGVSVESINNKLGMSYVKDDTFVPIKNVAKTETQLKERALSISGVKITTESSRVYTLGKEASQVIGYVQAISAEELEENKGKGYNSNSVIGKAGIEKVYEETLRGKDGKEIYIEDENGKKVKTIAKQEVENGKDVKLTIDANKQKQIYESLEENKGAYVAMNSKTGEIIALVSTPSYDSNDFALGMSTEEWKNLNEDEKNPLLNRLTKAWSPGSTFKPVTGAIGITEGKINPKEDFGRSGLSWQKDSSWGSYMVTTLTPYNEPANMQNALIRSDNIYFAKVALKLGYNKFMEGLNKLGFNEDINFEIGTTKSTYDTDGKITDEVQLADSGYGQGQILVNPIHMASIYSAFVNNGNMIKPTIIYEEDKKVEYLKENAISQEAANTIKEDLIQVVESPNGTAHDAKIEGVKIGAKTGTAELKASKDEKGEVLGWFNAFTADESSENQLVVVSMIEDANSVGGSHYLFPKVTQLFK